MRMPAIKHRHRLGGGLALGATLALSATLACGPAAAQSPPSGAPTFNAGFNRVMGQENEPFDPSTLRDSSGNLLIVDGIIQKGGGESSIPFTGAAAAASASASAAASASASGRGSTSFGGSLVVITQGNWTTVIAGQPQSNSGAFRSTADLNGKINLDGPN
jgi:holdfast attachment protein HfaA